MSDIREKALNRLMTRRQALQAQYDAILAEPASYGITGSVNATNRGLDELRVEIEAIDKKIESLLNRTSVAGMTVRWPNYRHWPVGGGL